MNNYLILKFEDSGLFRTTYDTKDKVFCVTEKGGKDRREVPQFVEPIVVNHISNMIHVLFGERPKSTNRYSPYDIIQYYYDKALNSYLKINTYVDNKGRFPSETVLVNKSVFNSWQKTSYMNWNRVYKLLEDEIYEDFTKTLSEILGFNVTSKSFNEVKTIILNTNDGRLVKLFDKMKSLNKTPVYSSIYGTGNALSDINKNKRTMLTVNYGPHKVSRLDGEIIIPVNDEDIEKLKLNKGCATLLDGGVVYIDSIKNANVINIDGFRKVSEISLERTKL